MRRKTYLRVVAWLSSAFLAATGISAQTIHFTFDQPDGLTYYQNLTSVKVTEIAGQGSRVDTTRSRVKLDVHTTEGGYLITATPISTVMTRNGQELSNPVLSLLDKLVITLHVDNAGQLVNVGGYDRIAKLLVEHFPPAAVEQLSSLLNEETMVSKETAEWDERVGGFAGAEMAIGEVLTSTTQYPLPNGQTIDYVTVVKIDDEVACGEGRCVRVVIHYDADPDALMDFAGDKVNDIQESVSNSLRRLEMSSSSLSGGAERVIDPKTMLIHSETMTRTLSFDMEIPDQGPARVTQREERTYTYEY